MFKIMKKSTYEGMLEKISELEAQISKMEGEIESYKIGANVYKAFSHDIENELKELRKEYESFKTNTMNDDENQVIMKIKDDLTTVIPIVKWKEGVENKMMELGLINDYPPPTPKAIQLSLMVTAYEAMEQIIESYSPAIHHQED